MIFLVSLLFFVLFTCGGLLAIWAATSPHHWFLRTTFFLGPTAAILLLNSAYNMFAMLVAQGATVAAGVSIAQWRQRRKCNGLQPAPQLRFSLTTLLLVMVLVSVGAAVVGQMQGVSFRGWQGFLLNGLFAGMATLAGVLVVCGRLGYLQLRLCLAMVITFVLLPSVWWYETISGSPATMTVTITIWVPILLAVAWTVCGGVYFWTKLREALGGSEKMP